MVPCLSHTIERVVVCWLLAGFAGVRWVPSAEVLGNAAYKKCLKTNISSRGNGEERAIFGSWGLKNTV
jgi:hypothetical protein